MSKIHSHLLKEGGEKAIGNNDAIWKQCQDTWSDLTSEKVAHGYVLAKRILERVEENGGGNEFLRRSCKPTAQQGQNVRGDFIATKNGIAPRSKKA